MSWRKSYYYDWPKWKKKQMAKAALLDKGHKMRTECGPKEIDDGTERS